MYKRLMLSYTRGTPTSRLLGVKNYSNNYFAMYARLSRFHTLKKKLTYYK